MTLHWKKSSYSSQNGGQCVEVAGLAECGFAVRDSKHRSGPTLAFDTEGWTAFLVAIRNDTLG